MNNSFALVKSIFFSKSVQYTSNQKSKYDGYLGDYLTSTQLIVLKFLKKLFSRFLRIKTAVAETKNTIWTISLIILESIIWFYCLKLT